MSNEIEYDLLKKLFIQKMRAIENIDTEFLDKLQQQHPELFDKRFLYQMLQKELEITSQELPIELDKALQEIIKNYHKIN